MPFHHPETIVKAAVDSTIAYIDYLVQSDTGVERHNAESIVELEDGPAIMDNTARWSYGLNLPANLGVRSDTSALLTTDEDPARKIEIRIVLYDRRTGHTGILSSQRITGSNGYVVIDFRWLVRRYLEWFRIKGGAIKSIEDLASRGITCDVTDDFTSEEQKDVIQKILTSGLTYVWGPPGTGKTTYVLAKTVQKCFDAGEVVLVLASTNLAVDNALSAILESSVPKEKVARIGVPSPKFISKYPECCEEKAFSSEIDQIKSEIKFLENQSFLLDKQTALDLSISRLKSERVGLNESLTDLRAKHEYLGRTMDECQNLHGRTIEELKSAKDGLIAESLALEQNRFKDISEAVLNLELEQVRLITEKNAINEELHGMGFFERTFTRKTNRLRKKSEEKEVLTRSITETLEKNREKQNAIRPAYNEGVKKVKGFEIQLKTVSEKILEIEDRFSLHSNELGKVKSAIASLEENLDSLEHELEESLEARTTIEGLPAIGDPGEALVSWRFRIKELQDSLAMLQMDLSGKSVLGMTLDCFIGFTFNFGLTVSRIFVDEAAYAPVVKVLPLLSLKSPICLLGDHQQLPPICECQNNPTIEAYWSKASIYLEDVFRFGNDFSAIVEKKEPAFDLTKMGKLTRSYRFGNSLATILDEEIYRMGLIGMAESDTQIKCISCFPVHIPSRLGRQNPSEVEAIIAHLKNWWQWAIDIVPLPSIAVLTPYKKQVKLIRQRMLDTLGSHPVYEHVEVLNTHRSQGKEWDYVLFSASDTNKLQGNSAFLSDSGSAKGRPVLNTTISRTKKELTIFLDADFWRNRSPPSLLTKLLGR